MRGLIKLVKDILIAKKEVHPIMKASTFFLGLTTGAIAGAVTVLYSTPKSGSEIRSTVSSDWKENFQELKTKINQLKGSVASLSREAKGQIPDAVDYVKQSVGTWKNSTSPANEKLQKELEAIQETLNQLEQTILSNQK